MTTEAIFYNEIQQSIEPGDPVVAVGVSQGNTRVYCGCFVGMSQKGYPQVRRPVKSSIPYEDGKPVSIYRVYDIPWQERNKRITYKTEIRQRVFTYPSKRVYRIS